MVDSMARRLMPCARREERGFTLIEVVMVLLLMALMAGLVFQWSPKLKAPDATTEHQKALMIARIAHARNQAVLRNKEVAMEVKNGTSLYYQNGMTPLTSESSDKGSDSYAVTFTHVKLTSSDGDSFIMTFDKDFTYEGPTTVTVTLTSDTSQTSTLSINGVGYVE